MKKLQIDNKVRNFDRNHPVRKLLDLIINNKMLLVAISKISMSLEMKKNITDTESKMVVENSLNNLALVGDITEEVAEEFMNLWINSNDDTKGKLLEEIIALLGPYKFQYNNIGCSKSSKVYDTNEEKNFDIIFYDYELAKIYNKNRLVEISGQVEFHECKKNVCNYIPCHDDCLKVKVKSKLDFMKKVKKLYSNSEFFIPTLHYNISGQQEFLNEKGYDFIKIISVSEIISMA